MPDPTTPPTGDAGLFSYSIKDGNLLIGGEIIDRISDPPPVPDEPEPVEAAEEPAEEVTPEPEEKAKEAEPPTKVEVPTPQPILPDKVKLKVKVYGEESEREFTKEELVAQVQKGLAAEKRFQEVSEKERQIEPFLHIKDSPEFKEWLSQVVVDRPDLAPVAPPPPQPEDVVGYKLRMEDPEFRSVLDSMNEWAVTLPVYEAQTINNNHRVFNMTYDRFKAARQAKVAVAVAPEKPTPPPIQTKEDAEKVIAAKERQKDAARTVPPSVAAGERDAVQVKKKQESELRKRVRSGDRNAEFALAALLYGNEL
jgi:hypothetical protein